MFEPNQTAFDLRFRLFGTPIRVHPGFWLSVILLGLPWVNIGFGFLALWVGRVFFSLLFHDFGHIIVGRFCGRPGSIVLYSLGGLRTGNDQGLRRGQRIAIYLAGPVAGLLLYGIVHLVRDHLISQIPQQFLIQNPTLVQVIDRGTPMLLGINLIWSLLNLVPILPLDGGMIGMEILSVASPRNGVRLALGLSMLLALLGAGYCLMEFSRNQPGPFGLHAGLSALLLGLLAFDCFWMLLAENKRLKEESTRNQEGEDYQR